MIRWALLVVALAAVGGTGWLLGRLAVDQQIRYPTVTESPTVPVQSSPPPDRRVDDPIVGRPGERIIERTETIRADDDDDGSDDQPAPKVTVIVPSSRPTPTPAPTTRPPTQRPVIPEIEVPEIPDLPEVKTPDLDLPLLR